MITFNEVLIELDKKFNENRQKWEFSIDIFLKDVRKNLLQEIADQNNRNIIYYYSPFLQGSGRNPELYINENDMNGFVSAIAKFTDKNKGLDLIIETPGGGLAATEFIVEYLKKQFNNDIRVIIPHLCMSAGTMIACGSKEILMLGCSSLGPFNPQYYNVPAQGVIEEFKTAIKDVEQNANRSLIWREIIKQYRPAFINQCKKSIECSKNIAKKWLMEMLENDSKCKEKVRKIINELCSFTKTKMHDRHYNYHKCEKLGLKVNLVKDNDKLYDLIMRAHYVYLYSSYRIPNIVKFIETNIENSFIVYSGVR